MAAVEVEGAAEAVVAGVGPGKVKSGCRGA